MSPGFLVLGSAETVGENGDLFELVDRTNKIYAKKATASRAAAVLPDRGLQAARCGSHAPSGLRRRPTPADFQREADRILLGRFAPPGVLVNENLDIIQFRGRTSPFLEPPPGRADHEPAQDGPRGLVPRAAQRARAEVAEAADGPHGARASACACDGATRDVDHRGRARHASAGRGECFLVLFHDADARRERRPRPLPRRRAPLRADGPARARDRPAAAGAGRHQGVPAVAVEQQDAANEELRSANEEILSSNEELQSTNEELETAKEELQSANEELTTVNEQLQHRNLELSQANNDLTNLLSSTNIPVVMVGGDLRIRRFTPPAQKSMNLLPTRRRPADRRHQARRRWCRTWRA